MDNEVNKIKLGKIEVSSKSTILVLILSILTLIGFCVFCISSCTKDIAIQYIKNSKQNIETNK